MTTYEWIKQLPSSLLQLDAVPLYGSPPPFPWDAFKQHLSTLLQVDDLQIQPGEWIPHEPGKALEGVPQPSYYFPMTMGALHGKAALTIPRQQLLALFALLQGQTANELAGIHSEYIDAMADIFFVALCQAFVRSGFDPALQPEASHEPGKIDGSAWTMDCSATVKGQPVASRLIISHDLMESWRERFAGRSLDVLQNSPRASAVQITVNIEAGRVSLPLAEWKKVHPGDCIILDQCSLLLNDEKKGRVLLTVNGMPFFRARLRPGSIKLLEHPLNYEVETPMPDKPTDSSYDHDDLESDEHSLFESQDESFHSEDESFAEHTTQEDSFEEAHTNAQSDTQADAHTESLVEDSTLDEAEDDSYHTESAEMSVGGKTGLNPEELTLPIIIEVGRIQMPIQKLLELQPGNVLDLDLRPESGVDLIVNGKRIGKGELLKVGESIGVRVLDLF